MPGRPTRWQIPKPHPVCGWLSVLTYKKKRKEKKKRVQGEESPSNKHKLWTKEGWRNLCWKNVAPLSTVGMLAAPPVKRRKIPGRNKLKKCKTIPTSCHLPIDWLGLVAFLFFSTGWRHRKCWFRHLDCFALRHNSLRLNFNLFTCLFLYILNCGC